MATAMLAASGYNVGKSWLHREPFPDPPPISELAPDSDLDQDEKDSSCNKSVESESVPKTRENSFVDGRPLLGGERRRGGGGGSNIKELQNKTNICFIDNFLQRLGR